MIVSTMKGLHSEMTFLAKFFQVELAVTVADPGFVLMMYRVWDSNVFYSKKYTYLKIKSSLKCPTNWKTY